MSSAGEIDLLVWVAIAASAVFSFMLSGMEAGVFALSRLRIRQQMRAGRPSAKALHQYLENPEDFLWTILVGSTVTNLFISGWVFVLLFWLAGDRLLVFVTVYTLVVFAFYIALDLLPKTLFRLYPNRLCIFMVRPFKVVHLLLRPLVVIVTAVSVLLARWTGGQTFTGRLFGNREELRLFMQDSAQTLTSEEQVMINRVLDFQSITVRQAMIPVTRAVTIAAEASVGDTLALCREKGFTRLPVWETRDGHRRIVGIVSCNTLLYQSELNPARSVREFLKPALFLDEDLRLEVALQRLQRGGQRLAIVLARDRRETGIITLQDVLRVIFGEVSL